VKVRWQLLFVAMIGLSVAGAAWAQQEKVQSQTQPQSQPYQAAPVIQMMGQCQADYQVAAQTADEMQTSMKQARESNDPARMREALLNAERSLATVQSRTSQCSHAITRTRQGMMGQAGMMGSQGQMMGGQNQNMGGQGHMMGTSGAMMPGTSIAYEAFDPVCRAEIADGTASAATYGGQSYQFCSEADREAFLKNPANYVRGPR
jgi:YHS domain-containing protein